jgi:hypothetical protein
MNKQTRFRLRLMFVWPLLLLGWVLSVVGERKDQAKLTMLSAKQKKKLPKK